jgi:hypothetical protein
MKTRIASLAFCIAAFAGPFDGAAAAADEPLKLVGRTEIAGYEGARTAER